MIYEIGWLSYDIRSILTILCFIPLLIVFIIFQKKYNTSKEDIDSGIALPKADDRTTINNLQGSKSHTKFMISLLLIVLMLISLSPVIDILF